MPEAGKDLEVNVYEVKDKIYTVVPVGGPTNEFIHFSPGVPNVVHEPHVIHDPHVRHEPHVHEPHVIHEPQVIPPVVQRDFIDDITSSTDYQGTVNQN